MNWTVQCAEYYSYRGVLRTNTYEFVQQSNIFLKSLYNNDWKIFAIFYRYLFSGKY